MLKSFQIPRWGLIWVVALFVIGLLARVLPLLDQGGRLLQQFPTEDGYLMLTIARNIAMGLGMSVSDGTIATNGTQPLVTFIFSLGYRLTGADKVGGVVFAHLVLLATSMICAYVVYRLAAKVLAGQRYSREAALILSAVFFASPQLIPHMMNFLETGVYITLVAVVVSVFFQSDEDAEQLWSWPRTVAVGVLLGLLFWTRIDSVFAIFAACLTYLFRGIPFGAEHLRQRFFRTLVFGATSVVVASPWLINNYINFGSLTPISGQAQAGSQFGENAALVPSILVEYLSVILPIPSDIQWSPPFVIVCSLLLLAVLGAFVVMWRNSSHAIRSLMVMGGISVLCYTLYYGLFFGAFHFMARYLSATAPYLALFTAGCLLHLFNRPGSWQTSFLMPAAVLVIALVLALNVRIYANGTPHQHSQVIEWVQAHVPDETWIGATQTGTLGYFHDRTVNLDGKVNPEALLARQRKKYCPPDFGTKPNSPPDCLMYYIVDKQLWYLADWEGITTWAPLDPIDRYFDVVVKDPKRNLGILKRHGAPEK